MRAFLLSLLILICLIPFSGAFAQGTWAKKANYPGVPGTGGTTFTIGDKMYVCDGISFDNAARVYLKSLWQYDPATNVWTQLADFPGATRFYAFAFTAKSKGYVGLGNALNFGGAPVYLNDFWKFDPVANGWSQLSDFPGKSLQNGINFSVNDKGYVGSGIATNYGTTVSDFWEYDPTNDKWTQKADFPLNGYGGVGFNIGNKGYAGTGVSNNALFSSDFFEYDPVADKWTRKADFGGGFIRSASGFSIGSKGYVVSGANDNCDCLTRELWVYNPTVDVWAKLADIPGDTIDYAYGVGLNGKGYAGYGVVNQSGYEPTDLWEYTADNLTEQKINFPLFTPKLITSADFDPAATATSNLAVTYTSSNTLVAQIINNKVHIVNTGTTFITASQAGNDGYRPANDITQILNINYPSADATLSNLTVSNGTLAPAFNSNALSYSASVSNTTTSVTVTPTVNDTTARVKVNGKTVVSGSPSASIPLNVGNNNIIIVVTAQNGVSTLIYTLRVIRNSTNAYLSGLTLSNGIPLSPAFALATGSYTASANNAITSITVTPTLNNANASIKVNGVAVASGTESAAISLMVGNNSIATTVTAQDGATKKTYTVTVARAASANDAYLAGLSASNGALTPVFDEATTGYTTSVANNVSSITVTPASSNPGATIKVNGTVVTPGATSAAIPLVVGNTTINIVVTAADGLTKKTYTIVVTRVSNNAYLSRLALSDGTLSPAFASTTGSYTALVSNVTTYITLTPTLNNPHASVVVNGNSVYPGNASFPIYLTVGNTTITTIVTAQDGITKKTYTVTVTRVSNNPYLSNLTLSNGTLSPAFAQTTGSYTASVDNSVASVTVTPTLNNPHSTITVNGSVVTSGTASAAIPLNVGPNSIATVVTAQDGTTHKTYTVTLTRAISGLNSPYLPDSRSETQLVTSLNPNVEANNILSPNSDGINDIWVIKNIAFYPNNTVTVYDNAGKIVFAQKGYTNDWSGTYRGEKLSDGTYYYSIDLGNGIIKQGFMTVVSR